MRKKLGIISTSNSEPIVYAIWDGDKKGIFITLSDKSLSTSQTRPGMVFATTGKATGKWYWEITNRGALPAIGCAGVAEQHADLENYVGSDIHGFGYLSTPTNAVYTSNLILTPNHMGSYTEGDILMFALDMDNGGLYIGVNGVWQKNKLNVTGVPTSGSALTGAIIGTPSFTGLTIFPAAGNTADTEMTANFGASAFSYPAPTGYHPGVF